MKSEKEYLADAVKYIDMAAGALDEIPPNSKIFEDIEDMGWKLAGCSERCGELLEEK